MYVHCAQVIQYIKYCRDSKTISKRIALKIYWSKKLCGWFSTPKFLLIKVVLWCFSWVHESTLIHGSKSYFQVKIWVWNVLFSVWDGIVSKLWHEPIFHRIWGKNIFLKSSSRKSRAYNICEYAQILEKIACPQQAVNILKLKIVLQQKPLK